MSTEANAPAANLQPENNEAAITAARAEGNAAGMTAGAIAERERILALTELDAGSSMSAGLTEAVNAGMSAGDFAIGLAKANAAKGPAALAALQADAVQGDQLPEAGAVVATPGAKAVVNRGHAYAEKKTAAKAA